MPGPAHPRVVLKLKTPSKITNGQQHSRFGVVGNCHFLGDGDPRKARIGHKQGVQTWAVEIWAPANFVFEYRWVEFQRYTSYIFDIEAIEPRRVELGLRALEVQNKFNIAGGTFKEDIGHPVYFASFCAPKRSLESSLLNERPRPRPRPSPPCRSGHAPAASKSSSTSLMSSDAVFGQNRQQASGANSKTQQGAVGDGILVERHASTLASSSSSEDNTSDDGSDALNISDAVFGQNCQQASGANSKTQQGAVVDGILVERHASTPASSTSSEDNTSDDGSDALNIEATAARESVPTDTKMSGHAHLKVALKLQTPSNLTNGQQNYRVGVVGNCHLLGDGEPQRARIADKTSGQTWVVEIWVPTNFVFEYRWVEFKRCTSYIFEIETIEPRRVVLGLRALEIRNKFNVPGGTFKEDIGHPVYFASFCTPKRSLESCLLNERPRPRPPCRSGYEPAASKSPSTSRGLMSSDAVSGQKRQQASGANNKTHQGAVSDEIVVQRPNNSSTLASSSSSDDNTSADGSYSLNNAATATHESVSTDTEVLSSDSGSFYTLTSMTGSDIQVQSASSDFSYPSTSSGVEPVHLSLPFTSGTSVPSVSRVVKPCASISAQSPSRQRHHAHVSAPDLGSNFHSSIHLNMESFDVHSHDLELTHGHGVRSLSVRNKLLRDNTTQYRQENLTNGLKEYLKTTFVPRKRNLYYMLMHLAWLAIGAAIHSIWLRYYKLNDP